VTATGLRISVEQVFANCSRHIAVRPYATGARARPAEPAETAAGLLPRQRRWIGSADTFFLATRSAAGAGDVSHRGGPPGFVRVSSDRAGRPGVEGDPAVRLRWPDYRGNTLLMTLGNLAEDPSAGLLFVDPVTGSTLQLTGTAAIDWSPTPAEAAAGAERAVEFTVGSGRELRRTPTG
jgi:predicted pyridoxine 5'-phosphate oxidase superfamily flavin-nucleotide-binding protein